MRALVLGGYGAVGAHAVTALRASGQIAVVAGRDPARAERVVDLEDDSSYARALVDIDVVINASGIEAPRLASTAARRGAGFVDVTATTAYVSALEALVAPAPVLVNVGLAPGLTNLLAAAVHAESPGAIELVVLLGAGERHGAAAVDWSYQRLGKRFSDPADRHQVRNYTEPRRFDLPEYGRRRLFRLDFSDQHALTRDLGTPVRTYFGLDSVLATWALAALTWIPGASRAPRGIHLPGSDRWLVMARGAGGATRWGRGSNQSRATGVMAALAATLVPRLPPGVHQLHRWMSLADVPGGQGIDVDGHGTKRY